MATEAMVRDALTDVIDPELGINIIDLGLVYEITINPDNTVHILMTLTSPGCPFHEIFRDEVTKQLSDLDAFKPDDVEVELTFDPPWSEDKMSDEARAELGFI